jgi:predicted ATPase
MSTSHNPYASALDGLELADPVTAFFDFCRQREQIRILRESGAEAPWSDDPIFQRGRFLNVFREDDRSSKAVIRFASPVASDLPTLIHALFFARWCNRQSTLDALTAECLSDAEQLKTTLETLSSPPWCNVTAYPVEAIHWQGNLYTRFETATTLLGQIKEQLTEAIVGAQGNVILATQAVNEMFGMANDFPIFMTVMDIAWFRPDVINPTSPVPTGIGAVAYLDRLQRHLGLDSHQQTCAKMMALQSEYWPEAKRSLQPIDIEYLSCECRKYYSYVNGTKSFEGKNLFSAGKSAQFIFDIPSDKTPTTEVQTQIYVIAGGPCSGKTTLLNALQDAGHHVEVETAERVLKTGIAEGRTAKQMRADPVQWQQQILQQDYALFDGLAVDEIVFTDTSFLETVVFAARTGIAMGTNTELWLRRKRYNTVFFLEPISGYENSAVRMETQDLALQISEQVRQTYAEYGYELVLVPAVSPSERLAFVRSFLSKR